METLLNLLSEYPTWVGIELILALFGLLFITTKDNPGSISSLFYLLCGVIFLITGLIPFYVSVALYVDGWVMWAMFSPLLLGITGLVGDPC